MTFSINNHLSAISSLNKDFLRGYIPNHYPLYSNFHRILFLWWRNESLKRFANKPVGHLLRASLLFCFLIQNVMLNLIGGKCKISYNIEVFCETLINYLTRKFRIHAVCTSPQQKILLILTLVWISVDSFVNYFRV